MYGVFIIADSRITTATEMLQQPFGYPCVEKFIGFIFMHDVLGELCILTDALLHFFLTNANMYFQ